MTYNLGRFILNPRGNYSASATYNKLDVVLSAGSSYVCKSDGVTNKPPTNTTYWQLLAQAGQAVMTPEQQQQVIADLIDNYNVVTDADYHTFTEQEKTKLAGLANANNGTLTINYNGNRLGQFSANQSGNTTINIPFNISDAKIKIVREDDDREIAKFSLNQKEDAIIKIPVGTGGGASVGKLTLTYDSSVVGEYNGEAVTIALPTPQSGTLTIKKNNQTVATFGANQSNNTTADITVPTSVSDLDDGNSVMLSPILYDANSPYGDDDYAKVSIEKLTSNVVIVCTSGAIDELTVTEYDYDITDAQCLTLPPTYIYITPDVDIDIAAPAGTMFVGGLSYLKATTNYRITVRGYVWQVDEISDK